MNDKKIISPIEFVNDRGRINQISSTQNSYQVSQTPQQGGMLFDGRLQMKAYEAELDIHKKCAEYDLKLKYQSARDKQKLDFYASKILMTGNIIGAPDGTLLYVIYTDNDKNPIKSKTFINATDYAVVKYVCEQPYTVIYLISFLISGKKISCKLSSEETTTMDAKLLHRLLLEKGVQFLVSARAVRDVMEALWSYTIKCAETVYIPRSRGWFKNEMGEWNYYNDVVTLEEVRRWKL